MDRIDLVLIDNPCIYFVVPSSVIPSQCDCELFTADGELIPSEYSFSIERDRKIFRIFNIVDHEKVRLKKNLRNCGLLISFFKNTTKTCQVTVSLICNNTLFFRQIKLIRRVKLNHEGFQRSLIVFEDNFINSRWIYLLNITSENEKEFTVEDKTSILHFFVQCWLDNSTITNTVNWYDKRDLII